jgi:hypothetical protein
METQTTLSGFSTTSISDNPDRLGLGLGEDQAFEEGSLSSKRGSIEGQLSRVSYLVPQ